MLGSSRVAAQLAASQEGLGSMSDDDDDDDYGQITLTHCEYNTSLLVSIIQSNFQTHPFILSLSKSDAK
jgi:hypothetical protein